MLEELTVLNYALIDRVHVKFSEGLNVLTGETGAGKSILVGALGLLLGQKTDTSIVRSGTEETAVTAVVRVDRNPEALEWLASHGVDPEDGAVILRRVVKKTGRGASYVQSTPVTRADLAELTGFLFDYHGQHEHQSLLKVENHRKLLDRYGDAEELAQDVAALHQQWSTMQGRLQKLVAGERERLREIDLLGFAVKEIDEARLAADEEERLEAEHKILANHERLFRLVEEVYGLVAEGRQGALAALRRARTAMDDIAQIDTQLVGAGNQLQDAFFEIEDFAETLRSYRSSVEFDPQRLAEVDERLARIRELERKYGDSIADVLEYRDNCEQELASLENWEDEKGRLTDQINAVEKDLRTRSTELSARRNKAAAELQDRVAEELRQLGMPRVRFRVLVQLRKGEGDGPPPLSAFGVDLVEFVISPNQGEPFKRLRVIASGGELSRVMLAIKSVLAGSDHTSALIFDEVDTGVGGQVAISVGERLHALSRSKQLLCITHLATIAVRADNHLRVQKVLSGDRTLTRVDGVTSDQRTEEISRMLSGDTSDVASLRHAEELIEKYGVRS